MASKVIILSFLLALSGCSVCQYQGKGISRENAQRMKNLGMDVQCSGEPLK